MFDYIDRLRQVPQDTPGESHASTEEVSRNRRRSTRTRPEVDFAREEEPSARRPVERLVRELRRSDRRQKRPRGESLDQSTRTGNSVSSQSGLIGLVGSCLNLSRLVFRFSHESWNEPMKFAERFINVSRL